MLKLGKKKGIRDVIGKYSLYENSNRNGEMLIEFAVERNLMIMRIFFKHKKHI